MINATQHRRGYAEVMDKAARGTRQAFRGLVLGHQAVFDELGQVWEECRHANWDGYQALPVSQDTLRNTYCVIESLPLGFPAPTVGAEPTGALTLEWYQSPRRTLSISVTEQGDLFYAALFGPNRIHGREVFFGEVPRIILELVRRVYAI
jgi:hypothetical protein